MSIHNLIKKIEDIILIMDCENCNGSNCVASLQVNVYENDENSYENQSTAQRKAGIK